VELDLSVPTAGWAIAAASQDQEAGRSPTIVDDDGVEMTLAEFRAKHSQP
jgi:hypothetical protein